MLRFKQRPKPLILLILDGWGHREDDRYNAIAKAPTACWDELMANYPHTLLQASGLAVGLPEGQMGNSEVGHLTLGGGRVIYQDLTRINKAIEEGSFFSNEVLCAALQKAKDTQKAVHILGLLSPGGVHSHEQHIYALLELAKKIGVTYCYLHPFLDGRDTPPKSAKKSIMALETICKNLALGQIVSLMGRYYAMDRDKRWDRTQAAVDCLLMGEAPYHADNALSGLEQAYSRGETDEFVKPMTIHEANKPPIKIEEGDCVIFMNFRADRARQLSRGLLDADFSNFKRILHPRLGAFVSLTHYASDIHSQVAFPPESFVNGLGEYLAKHHLTQLRIAETEKYAHVTFFFNGGIETPNPHETRLLIPSKKVATYDLAPKMSALDITKQLLDAIEHKKYDVIICNFANPDMLGHTGNTQATEQAITCIDHCIAELISALKKYGGEMIITADHGNAECMYDETTQQPHTAHTTEPVPFVYVGRRAKVIDGHTGTLADVAPTLIALLGLPKPKEMTGVNLIKLK
jgi:2,3-bisphosphoglycerate-independent phosphoglycerate mutase